MNKTKIAILGIVALFAVLTVSTATAHVTMYLDPQHSSVPDGFGYTTEVKVMANVTGADTLQGGQFNIEYDTSCCNVTDLAWGSGIFSGFSVWNPIGLPECHPPGREHIRYYFMSVQSDVVAEICTLTFYCNSTEYCQTDVTFPCPPSGPCITEVMNATNDNLYPDNATLVNGTFECGTPAQTYTISGTVPGVDTVNITNRNTSEDYTANVAGDDYSLTLDVPDEVETGNILRIIACNVPSEYESNCNVTDHVVVNAPGEDTNVDLTLNHYCKNYYPSYPYKTWEQTNWSGPAAMQMMVDHYRPEAPTQSDLNETGIAHNQGCNSDLLQVDPAGMKWTLNDILHNTSSYGGGPFANYGIGSYDAIEDVLHYMCKWHYLGPGAAPTYGDYTNWMAVRGIHTDVKPSFTQGSYSIYGFWINDPNPAGIGENTYKTVGEWSSTYHLSLTGVREGDDYNGKYVGVAEPPEDDDVKVNLVLSPERFNEEAKETVQAARALAAEPQSATAKDTGLRSLKVVSGIDARKLGAEIGDVVEEADMWIVQAAIDGAEEQLVPYDAGFAAVFDTVVADKPMLVKSDIGDYYIVPFAESYKESAEEIDATIANLEALKAMVPAAYESAIQAAIDALTTLKDELNLYRGEIMVVILVDADDGHFKEASWVTEPVEYLPVTKSAALQIADKTGASIELVYLSGSPYYPDWKITDGCSVYYVNQNGELYDSDADCDGYLISEGDCNDGNAAVYPDATEVCDGVDNNCDGVVDEGCPTDPSVIDYACGIDDYICGQPNPPSWCAGMGWQNVDNVLVRDGVCAMAATDGYAYITLDQGETKNSGTITVRSAVVDCEGEDRYGDTIVYGSADNSNWVTLGTFDSDSYTDHAVPLSDEQVRYVKVFLSITECGVWWEIDSITW